ncbi:unnamed protein product [Closterium sp. NIES-65]|nr:unnamed protein product [Closterium sp. NIES-65]
MLVPPSLPCIPQSPSNNPHLSSSSNPSRKCATACSSPRPTPFPSLIAFLIASSSFSTLHSTTRNPTPFHLFQRIMAGCYGVHCSSLHPSFSTACSLLPLPLSPLPSTPALPPGESPRPKLLSNFLLISYHNEIISVPLAPFTIFPTALTSSHPTHLLPPHSPPPTPLTSSHPTHLLPPHSPPPIPLISSHPTHLLPPHSPPPIPLISSHPTHLLPPHSSPPTPLISSHRTHLLPPHSTPSTPLTSSHPNHLLPPHSSPPKPLTSSHPNHLLPPHSPPPTPLTSTNSAPSIHPTLSNRQLLILSTLPCYAHHLTSSQMLSSVQCMNQLSPSTSGPPPLPAITLSSAPTPYQASSSTVVIASPGSILPSLPHHLH